VTRHVTTHVWPPRPLTASESEVLRGLLSVVDAPPETLDCQLRHARVIEDCKLGCGTITLAVDEAACPPTTILQGAPATGEAWQSDGSRTDAILHFREGFIRMIEVVRSIGETAQGLPPASTLDFYGSVSRSTPPET
jgi:hypothetical protein